MKHHHFTDEEKDWLKNQSPDLTYEQITKMFNERFCLKQSVSSIKDLMSKRMRLARTPKGRFQDGKKPKHDVDAEVIKGGYVWVKVSDKYFKGKYGNREYCENWRRKSDVVWEMHHGEIPAGKFLIFLDKNTFNTNIENLYPVNRSVHAAMCKNRWYSESPEFTLAAIKCCELICELKEMEKRRKKNDGEI